MGFKVPPHFTGIIRCFVCVCCVEVILPPTANGKSWRSRQRQQCHRRRRLHQDRHVHHLLRQG